MAEGKRKWGSKKRRSRNDREEPVKNATAVADDDHSDTERLKEATRTALILSSLKHEELEPETARTLLEMRERILAKPKTEANSLAKDQPEQEYVGRDAMEQRQLAQIPIFPPTELEFPPLGYSIDGSELPTLPPVKSLREKIVIGSCSKPFEKQVTLADVNNGQSGLSFYKGLIKAAILPFLGRDAENLDVGIPVTVYDSKGNKYKMVFKTKNAKAYVLTEGWTEFCLAHGLKANQHWVSVWMFRHKHTEKLCFVLTFRRFPIHSFMAMKSRKAKGIEING